MNITITQYISTRIRSTFHETQCDIDDASSGSASPVFLGQYRPIRIVEYDDDDEEEESMKLDLSTPLSQVNQRRCA